MVATTQDDSKQVEQAEGAKPSEKPKDKESTRDTIESILFAFVLAFMFRTFEAEAFVIPTGSMAPTLYGVRESDRRGRQRRGESRNRLSLSRCPGDERPVPKLRR